jgi:hypothetical protein
MKHKEDIEYLFKILPVFSDRVRESYSNLPLDHYLEENQVFRNRRFTKLSIESGKNEPLKETTFFQGSEINHYAGGVNRQFDPVEADVCQEFTDVYQEFIGLVFYSQNVELGLHQIRITCNDDYVGHPVPEGWHTDGFDYVAIACIAGSNFVGGTSRLRSDLDGNHDVFSRILQPSELIVFNDKKYFHHTDPINNRVSGKIGHRDILVTTISIK